LPSIASPKVPKTRQKVPAGRKWIQIINQFVPARILVNRGTADKPRWAVERRPYDFPLTSDTRNGPNERVLSIILLGREPFYNGVPLKGGPLVARVPKASASAAASAAALVVLAQRVLAKLKRNKRKVEVEA